MSTTKATANVEYTPVLVVTARNVEKVSEVYRTLFLHLPSLYFELEAKAQGNREPLTRKKNQLLTDCDMEGKEKITVR